jgi:hypothetical protein
MNEKLSKEITASHIIACDSLLDVMQEVELFCTGVSKVLNELKNRLGESPQSDVRDTVGTTGTVKNAQHSKVNEEEGIDTTG